MRYDKQSGGANDEQKQTVWKKQEEGIKNEESVGESGRLFIRNLSYSVTENDIKDLFKKFGPLAETTLPIGKSVYLNTRITNQNRMVRPLPFLKFYGWVC